MHNQQQNIPFEDDFGVGSGWFPTGQMATVAGQFGGMLGSGVYPRKEDIKDTDGNSDEKLWMRQMVWYFIRKSQGRVAKRQLMGAACKDAFLAYAEKSKTPTYPTGDGSVAVGNVGLEYINSIASPINILMGESASKEFEIEAKVVNAEARSRAELVRTQLFVEQLINSKYPELKEHNQSDLPPHVTEMLEYENRIDLIMEKLYRDVVAEGMERMLNDWMERNHFEQWRLQNQLEYQITNNAFAFPTIDPNTFEVKLPYITTDRVLWDVDSKDDFLTDAQYFITFDILSINACLLEFPHISREDILRMVGTNNLQFLGMPVISRNNTPSGMDITIMVIRCRFLYIDEEPFVIKEDLTIELTEDFDKLHSNCHYSAKTEEQALHIRKQDIYEVALIGGQLIGTARKYPYPLRSVETPGLVSLGCQGLIFGFGLHPDYPSSIMRVKGLQNYRNFNFAKLMKLVGQIRGATLIIKMQGIPDMENGDVKKNIMSFLKFYDEENVVLDDGRLLPGESVVEIKNGVSNSADIQQIMGLIDYLNTEIKNIMGINDSRTGGINKYESASNALLNKNQSDYATAYPQISYDNFIERTLQIVANYLKLSLWMRLFLAPDREAMKQSLYERLGDEVGQMVQNEDMIFEDVGIYVVRNPMSKAERMQEIKQTAQMMAQAQVIDLETYLEITQYTDPSQALSYIRREKRMKEKQAQMQQQQQAEAQMQQQQGLLQQQQQGQQQLQQQKQQGDMQLDAQNQMGNTAKSIADTAIGQTVQGAQSAILAAGNKVANATPESLR